MASVFQIKCYDISRVDNKPTEGTEPSTSTLQLFRDYECRALPLSYAGMTSSCNWLKPLELKTVSETCRLASESVVPM